MVSVRGRMSLVLFILTALWSTALASSTRPVCRSHRGDSSIMLREQKPLDGRSLALSEASKVGVILIVEGVAKTLMHHTY